MDVDVMRFASSVELAQAVASEWLSLLPVSATSAHLVALSGGRIASSCFDAFTERAVGSDMSFGHVHFFWSDERCVPPEHRDSNFFAAQRELLGPLGVAQDRIHRIRGEWKPDLAATEANGEIALIAPTNSAGLPVLDVVFLGMGEDGHVASLFPNAPASVVECELAYVVARSSSKPPPCASA